MTLKASDNKGNPYEIKQKDDIIFISAEDIPEGLEYIEIADESFCAKSGDEGYYVIADVGAKGSRLVMFNDKSDGERIYQQNLMPIFGIKKQDSCLLGIGVGYRHEMHVVFGVKDGEYYFRLRYDLKNLKPYEDISVKLVELGEDAGYSEMAVAYRNYQLDRGECTPLSEKIKEREAVKYAMESPEIRIRMGWKPAPPEIMEQTVENEPEMHVACTFERVQDLIDELKAQGVDKAQICLVGWNKSGHDGRWPQMFPVEEKLGGEEGLRKLIKYAQDNGYKIVCHTNSMDCYSIADTFSEDIVIKKQDGSLAINDMGWSGGRDYWLCPTKALELAETDLPKVRDLGFEGIHYIDVMAVVPLRWCFDKNHPSNSAQTLKSYHEIMKLSQELFGGYSSEGVFDFAAKYLDYGLYVSWPEEENDMVDVVIPLWPMVYHGITLYNPTTNTVNYPIKDKKQRLLVEEYGARPAFYIYSGFLQGSNQDDWLGKEDLFINTDEQLKYSVSKIKEAYDNYKKVMHLQTEYIVKHEITDENVRKVTYSDGTKITVDYN